jgi:hypothetical protein
MSLLQSREDTTRPNAFLADKWAMGGERHQPLNLLVFP